MKNCIIASTSTLYGGNYLDYLLPELKLHFKNCKSILFIPYAQPSGLSYDDYTNRVAVAFAELNIDIKRYNSQSLKTGWVNDRHVVSGLHSQTTNITSRTRS